MFLDLERSIHLGGEVNLRILNRLVSTINGPVRLVAPYESFTACFPMCRVNCNSGCALGCHLGPFYPTMSEALRFVFLLVCLCHL